MTAAFAAPSDPDAPGLDARAVPLLRLGSWYDSLDRATSAAASQPAVSLAPEILVRRDARRLRERAGSAVPGPADRADIVAKAFRLFAHGTVDCGGRGPQSAEQFRSAMWESAGLPAVLVDRWCMLLTARLTGSPASPMTGNEPVVGAGLRPITLVALPGNTFTCLAAVAEAVLSGSAVWVRPSTREPLSALRLVSALLAAGWPGDLLGFYPTAQHVLRALVAVTNRQIIYGGTEVCAALRDTPTATVRGPLRVCAVVPADADPAAAAAELLPLVAADGGRFCTAVRVILCLADPEPVAARLGRLLDAIPFTPADPRLPLAASTDPQRAVATAAAVTRRLAPGDRRVTMRPILSRTGQLTYLAPTLVALADPPPSAVSAWGSPALLGFEAPFPLATISRVAPRQADALAGTADLAHRLSRAGQGGDTGRSGGDTAGASGETAGAGQGAASQGGDAR